MADPVPYERTYSFTDYQAGNPAAPLPGIQVDNELENVEQSLGEAIDAIKDVRRSDGALKNGIVTVDSLSPTVAAGVGAGALASAAAAAASADAASDSAVAAAASATAASGSATAASGYASNALTSRNEAATEKTLAQTARTGAQTARDFAYQWSSAASGVDVNDGVNPVNKSAYHWAQVALGAATGALPDNSVGTNVLQDGAVTWAKLAEDVTDIIGGKLEKSGGTVTGFLALGDDRAASALRLGSTGQEIGRAPANFRQDFYNPEGVTVGETGGWRWLTDAGQVGFLNRKGQIYNRGVASAVRGDDFVGTFGTYDDAAASWVKANWRPGILGGARPAVLGLTTPSELATYASRDSVGLYVENVGRQPLVVSNCTFTSTRVNLGTALNAGLRASLRVGMIIDTGHSQKYSGIITGWDTTSGTWIDVSGWYLVVKGSTPGSTAAGQVPPGTQLVTINPQTVTWAMNVNTYVDALSQTGATVGIEMGMFNNKAAFDYNQLESGDDTSNSYGYDVVAIGSHRVGWGFTARSAFSKMWIGAEMFGMEYAGFVDSNNRLAAGNGARYGFLAQSGENAAFGVMTRSQDQVFRVDGLNGTLQVGTIGPNQGHRRNGTLISGTRNGLQLDGSAAGSRLARVVAFGVDANVDLQILAQAAGYVMVGRSTNTVGFYGSAGVAKQTGVAVTAAAIHAALVNLNLISA